MYKPASPVVFDAFKEAVTELKKTGLGQQKSRHRTCSRCQCASLQKENKLAIKVMLHVLFDEIFVLFSQPFRHTDFETSACRHRLELPGSMFIIHQV
jgi:hypothetical protein